MFRTIATKNGQEFSFWGTLTDDCAGIHVKVCDGKSLWFNESPIGMLSKLSSCRTMSEEEYVNHLKNALINRSKECTAKYEIDIYLTSSDDMMLNLTMESNESKGSTLMLLKTRLMHKELTRTDYFDVIKEITSSFSAMSEKVASLQDLNFELTSQLQNQNDDMDSYLTMKDALVDSMLTKMVYVLNHRRREAHIMKMRLKNAEESLQAKNQLAAEQRPPSRASPSSTALAVPSDTATAVAIAVAEAEERAERAIARVEEDVQRRVREAVLVAVEKTRAQCVEETQNEGKPRRARYVPWQNKTNYIRKRREGGAEDSQAMDGSSPPLTATVGKKRQFSNASYRRQLRKLENGGAELAESDSDASEAAAEAETFFSLQTQEVESSQLLNQLTQSQETTLNQMSSSGGIGGGMSQLQQEYYAQLGSPSYGTGVRARYSGGAAAGTSSVSFEDTSVSFLDGLFPPCEPVVVDLCPSPSDVVVQGSSGTQFSSLHDSLTQWPQNSTHQNGSSSSGGSSSSSAHQTDTAHSSSSSTVLPTSPPPVAVSSTQCDPSEGRSAASTKTSSVFTKAKRTRDPNKYRSALSRFLHEDSADSDASSDF